MANSTFMELTNRLLRKYNEVEITQADFSSVKGIHAEAKDAINTSLGIIMSHHYEWSFNAVEQTETLVAGTFEYAWPSDFKSVEWRSFQLQSDDSLAVSMKRLSQIDRDYYYRHFYDDDREAVLNTAYRGVPDFVFQTHGQGFGVTKNPDQAYELKYRYYKAFTQLSAYDDQTTVPPEFDHVIQFGAQVEMLKFLDNTEQARVVQKQDFEPGLRSMRTLLINDDTVMSDTRRRNVNVG